MSSWLYLNCCTHWTNSNRHHILMYQRLISYWYPWGRIMQLNLAYNHVESSLFFHFRIIFSVIGRFDHIAYVIIHYFLPDWSFSIYQIWIFVCGLFFVGYFFLYRLLELNLCIRSDAVYPINQLPSSHTSINTVQPTLTVIYHQL